MRIKKEEKIRFQGIFWHKNVDFSRQTCQERIDTDESPWAQADSIQIMLIMSLRELLNRQMSQSKHRENQASSIQNCNEGKGQQKKIEGMEHTPS